MASRGGRRADLVEAPPAFPPARSPGEPAPRPAMMLQRIDAHRLQPEAARRSVNRPELAAVGDRQLICARDATPSWGRAARPLGDCRVRWWGTRRRSIRPIGGSPLLITPSMRGMPGLTSTQRPDASGRYRRSKPPNGRWLTSTWLAVVSLEGAQMAHRQATRR